MTFQKRAMQKVTRPRGALCARRSWSWSLAEATLSAPSAPPPRPPCRESHPRPRHHRLSARTPVSLSCSTRSQRRPGNVLALCASQGPHRGGDDCVRPGHAPDVAVAAPHLCGWRGRPRSPCWAAASGVAVPTSCLSPIGNVWWHTQIRLRSGSVL